MQQRHVLYLSVAMTERLKLIADTHRLSKSEILERAVQAYLAAEADGGPAHLLALQLERNERAFGWLERDVAIATEVTFVRFFAAITPPLPKGDTEAARALGQQRFRQIIAAIGRRLNSDDHLIARVLNQLERTSTERPPTEGVETSSKKRDDGGVAEVGATRGYPRSTRDSRTILEPLDPC